MEMILKVLGAALIAWGLVDLLMSFNGTDVWGEWLGVQLPELLYKFSHYAAILAGAALWGLGSKSGASDEA